MLLAVAALNGYSTPARAQDASLLAGVIESDQSWPHSYAWAFSYRHLWTDNVTTTIAYLNGGHFPGHHRDGIAAELWGQAPLVGGRLTLGVGIGPFRYYDTTVANNGGSYSDNHGIAWLYSAGATWHFKPTRWFAELRVDRTSPSHSIQATSIAAGVGYHLEPDAWGAKSSTGHAIETREATVFFGKTVVNSFSSQASVAKAAEYREALGSMLRASVAFLNEGDARLVRRSGGIAEGWLEPGFFEGRWTLGIGVGVYAAIDKYRPTPGRHLSGLVTMTTSYQLADHVDARFNWHRIVTDYDRDTDIVLFGLGYRF